MTFRSRSTCASMRRKTCDVLFAYLYHFLETGPRVFPLACVIRYPSSPIKKLKALETNYARVKGEVFRWNSHLVSFSIAHISDLMTLMSVIHALSLEYDEKRTELDEWRQEYLANLVAFRDREGRMAELRRLIRC
ncbi:hypothetical protein AMTR_s00180p00039050 [Amborella trichopoda]|uniref:Uncharacterized protein n=1 Tax=Amborella trichopoda TaxID=13333 RepID=W1PXT9_AMBTC|nr:hypothetical protein AMTR_s00180p00039050 [Amborella trichopoda]